MTLLLDAMYLAGTLAMYLSYTGHRVSRQFEPMRIIAATGTLMRSAGFLLFLACIVGCGTRTETLGRSEASEAPVIRVVNQNRADMEVYLTRDGTRTLLGLVTAGSTDTFPVPPDMIGATGDLRLIADPVGSTLDIPSERFQVDPGRVVEWTIRVTPASSSLVIY